MREDWGFSESLPKAAQVPNSSLAYVGDAYYELYLRTWLLTKYRGKSGGLHRLSIRYAQARFQASVANQWIESGCLSDAEAATLQRGRNANPGTMAKHATPMEYRWATGLETLIGWLYLQGCEDRIDELLAPILEKSWTKQEEEHA